MTTMFDRRTPVKYQQFNLDTEAVASFKPNTPKLTYGLIN